MTYRSNPFDKQDYSKFAFKKSELLAVIQAIDENFSFDLVNADLQENKELLHIEANTNVNHEYKLFLFKKPLLTFHEAACIMTGYDPQYVEQCQNDTNFKQNFSNYLGAYDYISTCIDAQMLSYDSYSNRLCASEFKQFLAKDGVFIDGFNDDLQGAELEKNTDSNNTELQQLKLENEKLKAELAEKDQKIKELESLNPKNDMDLLSLIFDESATEIYAPDLVNAIKLWKYLYVDNKSANDSHSSRANHWIGKNTPYKGESTIDVKRLREVTSPFNSWHSERKNKLNK